VVLGGSRGWPERILAYPFGYFGQHKHYENADTHDAWRQVAALLEIERSRG
jgi:hypothetical protein